MTEGSGRTQATFMHTYTYDQFTVFFYGDHVIIGRREYPIGQCCVDVMNLNESVLKKIARRTKVCISAAVDLLTKKTDSAAAFAQERLNDVWDLVFTLPVYRDLNMDKEVNYHTFQRLMADPEKWAQVQDPNSEGHAIYQGMLTGLARFADRLLDFRGQVHGMTERYFEPLERRNSDAYAEAYADFYSQMIFVNARLFNEDFEQSFPMEVNFVPKISAGEWNAAVATAQDLVAQSERGELTDEELKRRLAEL